MGNAQPVIPTRYNPDILMYPNLIPLGYTHGLYQPTPTPPVSTSVPSIPIIQTEAPSTLPPPPPIYSDFEKNILNMHNIARKENNLPPLEWDAALQQRAGDWAKFLSEEQGGKCFPMRHPGNDAAGNQDEITKYLPDGNGQNLYQANGSKLIQGVWVPFDPSSPGEAVRRWYNECNVFKPLEPSEQLPSNFLAVGHMTQLLWEDTKKLGCAYTDCTDDAIDTGKHPTSGKMIVCNYDKGNVRGQFQKELPPSIKCEKDNVWIK